jgi:hypothetical protein
MASNNHVCEYCQQSFPSRNLLFKHLRDSPSCVQNVELLSAAPSVQKQHEKKRKHEEFLSRTKRTPGSSLSLNAQRSKSSLDCSCLWFGDLPLAWTRHGGKFKRLRALLRSLLPDDVPDPWIQHVQRKAYRKNDHHHHGDDDPPPSPDDDDDDPTATTGTTNQATDTTTTTTPNTTSRSYVGYAIIAFRDPSECQTVMKLLDGVEVSVEQVFNQRDIASSQDFNSFRQSKTAPFRLRVTEHLRKKSTAPTATTSSSASSADDDDAPASTLPPPPPPSTTTRILDVDPPLMDLFRPLTTEELCQRTAKKKRSGQNNVTEAVVVVAEAATAAMISHEEALRLAVATYESVGSCRPVVRSQGREIPIPMRDKLQHILHHLRWAVPNQRQGLSVERYLVLLTKVVGSNNKKDAVYGDLRDACQELMDWADPTYYYSGIAVTKNFCGSPHIDHRDRNFQYAVSFMVDDSNNNNNAVDDDGVPTSTAGGGGGGRGGELCVDGTDNDGNEVIHVVTTLNRMAAIDGRCVHWVRPWKTGIDRYSLIFYDTSCEEDRPRLPRGVM